jgi:hypothetical protein
VCKKGQGSYVFLLYFWVLMRIKVRVAGEEKRVYKRAGKDFFE